MVKGHTEHSLQLWYKMAQFTVRSNQDGLKQPMHSNVTLTVLNINSV